MFKRIMLIVMVLVILNTNNVKAETEVDFPQPTNKINITPEECIMLQKIAVAEAHDTNSKLMAEIMLCVINRRDNDNFPNTIENVIKEKGQFSTYPKLYNKYKPNEMSFKALGMLPFIENKQQLFFENTVKGSWISSNKELIFVDNGLCFYK